MSERPVRLAVVTGTGTEVGKTWVAASAARRLRDAGIAVAARKPAQSYTALSGVTDAEVLAHATGADPAEVCPRHRWYPVPLAPPMAADALGAPRFTIADLVGELFWPPGVAVGLVEGAGGPRSPLAHDGDTVDFCAALRPDLVVLVAGAGLGTINAVRLCAAALTPHPLVVVLNRYDDGDDLHRRNRAWLTHHDGLEVVTSPADLLATRLYPAIDR